MSSSLKELANRIAHQVENITTRELEWHMPGKWSIAQILEHLSLTYSGTKIGFDRCLQSGKPSATAAKARDRVRAFVVTRLGYMPSGLEAPAGTRPKGIPSQEVLTDIGNKISAMEQAIRECEQRLGSNVKLVNHPILGPLTAEEWRRFHCVHGRHHLRQIRRLRNLMKANGQLPAQL